MVVQWTTAETGSPVVMYGKSASASANTVQAMTKTYNASDFCGEPANTTGYVDPGMLHYGTLSNLSYSTRYFYQYGDKVSGNALLLVVLPTSVVFGWLCTVCTGLYASAQHPSCVWITHYVQIR